MKRGREDVGGKDDPEAEGYRTGPEREKAGAEGEDQNVQKKNPKGLTGTREERHER